MVKLLFRGINEDVHGKLICKICEYVESSLPQHHGRPLRWFISGNFEKSEYLKCEICDYIYTIPLHCNIPMYYSEGSYLDLPDFSKNDFKDLEEHK